MKAILLAAGQGKRMGEVTNFPKSLILYNGESLIKRLIRQLKQFNVNDITVVIGYMKEEMMDVLNGIEGVKTITNIHYNVDKNIYSMIIGMREIDDDVVVLEADMITSDGFIGYVVGTDFENRSVWFTRGKLAEGVNGGVLKTDGKNTITDIKIIDEYSDEFIKYDKITGVMRIAKSEINTFKKYLNEYSKKTLQQYYLIPWIENLKDLPCEKGDASHYLFSTFNTPEEFEKAIEKTYDKEPIEKSVYFANVNELRPVEDFDSNRLDCIEKHIIKDGYWIIPIKISEQHQTVMDGHHSLALAIEKGYKRVPVIGFNYDDVDIFSLHEEVKINKNMLVVNALEKRIMPYKTAKHILPPHKYECKIKLEELK